MPPRLRGPRVPRSVKAVFDYFPLYTYESVDLPRSALESRHRSTGKKLATVYVHTNSCQSIYVDSIEFLTLLKLVGLYDAVDVVEASEHSSATTPLPFVVVAGTTKPLGSRTDEFWAWAAEHGASRDRAADQLAAAVVAAKIVPALDYALFLQPWNYRAVVLPYFDERLAADGSVPARRAAPGDVVVASPVPALRGLLGYRAVYGRTKAHGKRNNVHVNDDDEAELFAGFADGLEQLSGLATAPAAPAAARAALFAAVQVATRSGLTAADGGQSPLAAAAEAVLGGSAGAAVAAVGDCWP
ncbi:uncharacterized protein V1510DRAFT_430241 [Dipodascopsis tothii]|uniref:uncharacterized protein n=1 Tax=Dipodascopsis tothii TaxID=44089 RepID=UPI0034CDDEBB